MANALTDAGCDTIERHLWHYETTLWEAHGFYQVHTLMPALPSVCRLVSICMFRMPNQICTHIFLLLSF